MKKLLIFFFVLRILPSFGQLNYEEVVHYFDSLMQYGVDSTMIPGGIISIMSSDSVYLMKGYGYSDLSDKQVIDPETTLFQLASVGKVFTSIAVLQQVDEGKLNLETDVNSYLEGWQIDNPYNRDITISHLLTHSAGFDERVIGYMARSNDEVESLGKHLKKNMPALFQRPGKSINYSNYSFALAGHLVELSSGLMFSDYIKTRIFRPLGMVNSTYYLPDNYPNLKNYAKGHEWKQQKFNEVKAYPRHAIPAGSILSTATDMTIFVQKLLQRDTLIISESSFDLLLNQQFTNHPKLTGYTLGLEVQNFNGQPSVGKGGNSIGFLSILLLFPDHDLGLFISLNTESDNLLELLFEGFINKFFPLNNDLKDSTNTDVDIDIEEYTGIYSNERANHHTFEEFFALYMGQFSIWESENGNLAVFHNGKRHEYQFAGDDVFTNVSNPYQHLVFERNTSGDVINLYRNIVIGGIQIPSSLTKIGWFERPRFMNDEYPYAMLIIVSYLFLPLIWLVSFFIRKKKANFLLQTRIPAYYHATAILFLILFLWNIIGFFIPLLQHREELFFGINPSLVSMKYFNWAMAITAVGLVFLSIHQWIKSHGNWMIRIYYLLYSLVAVSYILILHRWHFLNVVYN